MVFGAVIAAAFDLTFDMIGVMYVLANDVLTSLVGVLMEKKMDAKDFNSWGLMYYNSLFSIPALFLYMLFEQKEVRPCSVIFACSVCHVVVLCCSGKLSWCLTSGHLQHLWCASSSLPSWVSCCSTPRTSAPRYAVFQSVFNKFAHRMIVCDMRAV